MVSAAHQPPFRSIILNDPCTGFLQVHSNVFVPRSYMQLLHFIKYALHFSHDTDLPEDPLDDDIDYSDFTKNEELHQRLVNQFFDRLYIAREEVDEVHGELAHYSTVFLRGLVGEGKSCIMYEACRQQIGSRAFPVYVNLKRKNSCLDRIHERTADSSVDIFYRNTEIDAVFESAVIDEVLFHIDEAVNRAGLASGADYKVFKACCYLTCDLRTGVRDYVSDIAEKRVTRVDDVLDVWEKLNHEYIRNDFQPNTNMFTYMEYFRYKKRTLVLYIDNCDRLPIYRQQQLITIAVDWGNHPHVKCVVAIREQNLQRVGATCLGADPVGGVLTNKLCERREDKSTDPTDDEEKLKAELVELVRRRLTVLHELLPDLLPRKAAKEGEASYDKGKEFLDAFIAEYEKLLDSNLGIGYYRLCNYSLRVMPYEFALQVLRLRFGPEMEYYRQIDNAYRSVEGIGQARTQRNTFFYKLCLANRMCIPNFSDKLLNVFGAGDNRPFSSELAVLEYLIRQYEVVGTSKDGRAPWTVRAVFRILVEHGWKVDEVAEAVEKLGDPKTSFASITGFIEKHQQIVVRNRPTLVMSEGGDSSFEYPSADLAINQDRLESWYSVLPAGFYFMRTLALSCEYAFWAIVDLQHNSEEYGKMAFQKRDYDVLRVNDGIKLEVVHTYLRSVLLDKCVCYRKHVESTRADGDDAAWVDYLHEVCVEGIPYPIRLVRNIARWIRHARLRDPEKLEWRKKYLLLRSRFEEQLGVKAEWEPDDSQLLVRAKQDARPTGGEDRPGVDDLGAH